MPTPFPGTINTYKPHYNDNIDVHVDVDVCHVKITSDDAALSK